MIRDSKDVSIKIESTYYSHNFAVFIQQIIDYPILYQNCYNHIQRFCIQAIKNNHSLIFHSEGGLY